MSLSVQSRGQPRRKLAERTFVGCDEVGVEGCDDEDEDDGFGGHGDFLEDVVDVKRDDAPEDAHELDLEFGFGFHGSSVVHAFTLVASTRVHRSRWWMMRIRWAEHEQGQFGNGFG